MQRIPTAAALLAAASLALAAPLLAQDATDPTEVADARIFRVGLRAGVGVPLGFLAESGALGGNAEPSFGFAGLGTFRFPALPVAVRGELSYDRFGADLSGFGDAAAGFSANWGIIAGTLNAVAELPAVAAVRPYVLGGVGFYRAQLKISQDDVSTGSFGSTFSDPGVNGGGGVRFRTGRVDSFVEVRYHTIFADERLSYVPIAFGVEF